MFADYGCKVVIADIYPPRASIIAKEIDCQTVAIDVDNEASIKAATVWGEKNIGPIDILVTSAGVLQKLLRAHKLKQDDWDHVVQIDQRGTFINCREVGCVWQSVVLGALLILLQLPACIQCHFMLLLRRR